MISIKKLSSFRYRDYLQCKIRKWVNKIKLISGYRKLDPALVIRVFVVPRNIRWWEHEKRWSVLVLIIHMYIIVWKLYPINFVFSSFLNFDFPISPQKNWRNSAIFSTAVMSRIIPIAIFHPEQDFLFRSNVDLKSNLIVVIWWLTE